MITKKKSALVVLGALLVLAVIAAFSMQGDMSVMVDGEHVTGLAGFGCAFGGLLIGMAAVFLAVCCVSLAITGISIFVMIVLALVFLGVLLLLSPLLFPLLFVVGVIWFFSRKKPVPAA